MQGFCCINTGKLCSVRLSEGLGVSALVRGVVASVRSTLAVFEPCESMARAEENKMLWFCIGAITLTGAGLGGWLYFFGDDRHWWGWIGATFLGYAFGAALVAASNNCGLWRSQLIQKPTERNTTNCDCRSVVRGP